MGWNHNFISGRKWDFSLHTTSRSAVQAYAAGYPMGISGRVTIYLYLLLLLICEQHLQLAHSFLWYGTKHFAYSISKGLNHLSHLYTAQCRDPPWFILAEELHDLVYGHLFLKSLPLISVDIFLISVCIHLTHLSALFYDLPISMSMICSCSSHFPSLLSLTLLL
jgi:hypothetical protein